MATDQPQPVRLWRSSRFRAGLACCVAMEDAAGPQRGLLQQSQVRRHAPRVIGAAHVISDACNKPGWKNKPAFRLSPMR